MSARRRGPSEKVEQAHIVQLLRSIGSKVYVLGTRRRHGDFQGTMQTPGIADLFVFLPAQHGHRRPLTIECKANGGRLRPEQQEFRELCASANLAHVTGDLNAVIAWLTAAEYLKRHQVPHYRQPTADTHVCPNCQGWGRPALTGGCELCGRREAGA